MKKHIAALFAQSPVHVGAGNSVGAVDMPVVRERHTRIPVIPGSALKGVLSTFWGNRREKGSDAYHLFGGEDAKEASAGQLLIGEARVLAFPVRSARKSFAWVTSPLALLRLKRDAGLEFSVPDISSNEKCRANPALLLDGNAVLEEYLFESSGDCSEVANALKNLLEDELWTTVAGRLVVVSDEIFSYFVENACEIATRIKIDEETGTVKNGALFNQEQVPSETMFYFPLSAVSSSELDGEAAVAKLKEKLDANGNLLQVGGDASIGLGFCKICLN